MQNPSLLKQKEVALISLDSLFNSATAKMAGKRLLSLLMPVLAQTFLTFVRCHLMSLSFLSAWHTLKF